MGFLGQGLQRTARVAPDTLQIVGMDYVSAAGAFNWTVPAGVDVVDIIAVGASSACYPGYSAGSGAVSQRVGKTVTAGQVISGIVGAGAADSSPGVVGGSTTVDGMTAEGSSGARSPLIRGLAYGGDANFKGLIYTGNVTASPGISSLVSQTVENGMSTDYGLRINNLAFSGNPSGTTTGNSPGGAPFAGSVAVGGTNGGVIFIMYRRAV
ncbi:hypothetical protein M5E06_17940 [Azospirillum sp. A1-3]|uniref:hypothetical protein n=1 Tax=Azospirillum sp. A1-3 TaxID=185874 RepID=UPI0020771755|nr:hypothetical protein [Azospirillum sp. A1-3]MCM8736018.1 hypothetical protein [Azospirillum sp. A1-3]